MTSAHPRDQSLLDHVNRAKARWLKRIMYDLPQITSTEKCLAYAISDHLNCATLDCWPSQVRLAQLLGFKSTKTVQRTTRGLQRHGVLTIKRRWRSNYRYAPIFFPGDEDKIVASGRRGGPNAPDKNVRESFLTTHPNLSSSTEVVADDGEGLVRTRPSYDRRRRGAIEMQLAEMFGKNGFDVVARLAELDDAIVDRLCRAFAEGQLGEREIYAARLAAEQVGWPTRRFGG